EATAWTQAKQVGKAIALLEKLADRKPAAGEKSDPIAEDARLHLGLAHRSKRNWTAALAEFARCRKGDPAPAYYAAITRLDSGDAKGAERELRAFLEAHGDHEFAEPATYQLCKLALVEKRLADVRAFVAKLAERFPKGKWLPAAISDWCESGLPVDARDVERMIAKSTESAAAASLRYALASLHLREGRYAECLRIAESLAAGEGPARRNAAYLLGAAAAKLGDWNKAAANLRDYLLAESDDDDAAARASARYWLAQSLVNLSAPERDRTVRDLKGSPEGLRSGLAIELAAAEQYKLALSLASDIGAPNPALTAALARARFETGDEAGAERLLSAARPTEPADRAAIETCRGLLHLKRGESKQAAASFGAAFDAAPQAPAGIEAGIQLVRLETAAKNFAAAEKAMKALLSSAPAGVAPRIKFEQALLLAAQDRTLEAISELRPLAEQTADAELAGDAGTRIADLLEARGETANADRALAELEAKATGGAKSALSYRRAVMEFRRRDYASAAKRLETLLAAQADRWTIPARLLYGDVLLEKKDAAGAEKAFREVASSAPDAASRRQASLRLAECMILRKDWKGAETAAKAILAEAPGGEPAAHASFLLGRTRCSSAANLRRRGRSTKPLAIRRGPRRPPRLAS
ncbi:MAG TPA: tetratricopeptide repeat protein, partial [Planctomycetia bacterium]|nr:tetratricopeptide repeat protein [Planctomycetia bacterium]